jgi:thiol-disulfide isomerase/thioredoxin
MAYLTGAVVLVGLLCLLDLVLTLGVVRRLREHTSLLEQRRGLPAGFSEPPGVPVGETVGGFVASTAGGEPVSRELLAGRTLVGFFAPGCGPCAEQLPVFIERARSMPGGRMEVLALVIGGDGSAADQEYGERLAPVAQVVMEAPGGPLQQAFRVSAYPTLFLVDTGGVVVAGGVSMSALEHAPEPPVAEIATA